MRARSALALALGVVPAGSLWSQPVTRLDSAARIRVTAPAYGLRGQVATVLAHGADTLWVRTVPQGMTVALPASALMRVELSRGRQGHARRGAAVGAVSGAVLGAALAYAFPTDPADCGFAVPCGREYDALGGAFYGAPAGALIGAIFGATQRTEQWRVVIASQPVTMNTGRTVGIQLQRSF